MKSLELVLFLLAFVSTAGETPRKLNPELTAYLALPEEQIDLAKGALLVSKEEHADVDVAAQLKAIDAIAARLKTALAPAENAEQRSAALKKILFDEDNFQMPFKDDSAAFLLSDVLKNKRGNCLGLSVLALALAERTNLPLFGVPVPSRSSGPGHLLVRFDDGKAKLNFDPTERGLARPDSYYVELFKVTPEDLKRDYILKNAKKKDVLILLLVNLAGARVEAGRAADSIALLDEVLRQKPVYAPAYNNLGAAKLSLGDWAGSEKAYRKAIELDSGMVGPHLGLAQLFSQQNNPEAEAEIAKALVIEPENIHARVIQINALLAQQEYVKAVSELSALSNAHPKDADLLCNLGYAATLAGNYPDAENAYRRALEVQPENPDALCGIGRVLSVQGNRDAANASFALALKAQPAHAATLITRAKSAQQFRDWPAAIADYDTVLKTQPSNLEALNGIAQALVASGKPAEAVERLNRAAQAQPDNLALASALADAKMSANDVVGALTTLKAVLAKTPERGKIPVLQRMGICYGKQKNHRQVFETAEQILKLDPKNMVALRLGAAACEGFQNRAKALEYYRKILEIEPNDAKAREALKRLSAPRD